MPVSDSAAPIQWSRPMRSSPSPADSSATSTGVAPIISELFATLVRDSPAMKKY
jgi:hypothetical protein